MMRGQTQTKLTGSVYCKIQCVPNHSWCSDMLSSYYRTEWVKCVIINYFNLIAKNILYLVNRAISSVVMMTNETQCVGNVELITLPV
jgi:hypothetical protein